MATEHGISPTSSARARPLKTIPILVLSEPSPQFSIRSLNLRLMPGSSLLLWHHWVQAWLKTQGLGKHATGEAPEGRTRCVSAVFEHCTGPRLMGDHLEGRGFVMSNP